AQGLLAWATDVVGGNESGTNHSDDPSLVPLILNPHRQQYLTVLNHKAASLNCSIKIYDSESLLILHVDQREAKLQEENAAYEKNITCQAKTLENCKRLNLLQLLVGMGDL
ncbi:Heptaprenylglyceryl phosphate synthase, partial [Bienertia sinuspersici]